MKMKTSCFLKDTIMKMKGKPQTGKKTFANDVSDKGLALEKPNLLLLGDTTTYSHRMAKIKETNHTYW